MKTSNGKLFEIYRYTCQKYATELKLFLKIKDRL